MSFGSFTRKDVVIPSCDDLLSAWLYVPNASTKKRHPALLLAHGLGGRKEYGLNLYAERFTHELQAVCLVFDYRHWAPDSKSKPTNLIDFGKQSEDWSAALEYLAKLEEVDSEKIGLFGSSFSGGHVIVTASKHAGQVKAVVSQCPFTDGFVSALQVGVTVSARLAFWALADLLRGTDEKPICVPLCGKPGEVALLNSHDTESGYGAIMSLASTTPKVSTSTSPIHAPIPARLALSMPLLFPGSYLSSVTAPVYLAVCGDDIPCPAPATVKWADKAKAKGNDKLEVHVFDGYGHFDIYLDEKFERVVPMYIDFFRRHLQL